MLVTLELAKAYLGIPAGDTAQDVWLTIEIEGISDAIETYCQRDFNEDAAPRQASFQPFESGSLLLPGFPILEVSKVTVTDFEDVATDLAQGDYFIQYATGLLFKTGTNSWLPYAKVEVTYKQGFSTVPPLVQRITLDLLKSRYMTQGQDPTRNVRAETVYEVSSVTYESQTAFIAGAGMGGVLGMYASSLDFYRSERAVAPFFDGSLLDG